MNNYTTKDTNPMSWNEFDVHIQALIDQINTYCTQHTMTIDVICPLLRSGGIVGSILANKMKIIPQLPVQFKYSYKPTTITQIISVPDILVDVPAAMNILLVDGNTATGSMAAKAAEVVQNTYPTATIYLATLAKVYGVCAKIEGIAHIFCGTLADEKQTATKQEKQAYSIRSGVTIFPWENTESELAEINAF
jgi:hypoxanthine phosphoribosyltransferase